jgi:glutamate N-acetyltransferase/amino-acid N-acetyltransferase
MKGLVHLNDPHIALVPGFRAAGVACGLKKDGALDLALVSCQAPCAAAAVFTTNRIQAAPVVYDRDRVSSGAPIYAVVINSGNANACTGARGLADVRSMAESVSQELNIPSASVLVMSTGVIGQHLPLDRVADGIAKASLALSAGGGHDAGRAIMTTDTRPKEVAVQIEVGGKQATIAGMCKGAGMIHPNMATMLALIATDVAVTQNVLQQALRTVTELTFNMITVDGDTSTNDTVLVLANGLARNPELSNAAGAGYEALVEGLLAVSMHLAQSIVRDGEGATKFVTIRVLGAPDSSSARQVAKSIANSNLVKTAVYGQDANWGRVICAAGYSGVEIDPERLSMWLENDTDSLHLVKGGVPYDIDEPRAASILAGDELCWRLDLGLGDAQAEVWTCDLTHAYVDINAHYRT